MTDELSDERSFGRPFQVTGWDERGERSLAIKKKSLLRLNRLGDFGPRKKCRIVGSNNFNSTGGENMMSGVGARPRASEFPELISRMQENRDGNDPLDPPSHDQGISDDAERDVLRSTCLVCEPPEEAAQNDSDRCYVNFEFTGARVERGVTRVGAGQGRRN